MKPDAQRCVIASRHGEGKPPPLAAPGLFVCHGHASKLADMLAGVAQLVEDLLVAHSSSTDAMSEKVTSTPNPGLRYREEVTKATNALFRTLQRWARGICTERGWQQPRDLFPDVLGVLERNLDWLLARPEVAEFHDTLDGNLREARRQAFPSGRRRIDITMPDGTPARCIDADHCDVPTHVEVRCTGTLTAVVAPVDDLLPSWIECNGCGRQVTSAQWLAYGRRLHKETG